MQIDTVSHSIPDENEKIARAKVDHNKKLQRYNNSTDVFTPPALKSSKFYKIKEETKARRSDYSGGARTRWKKARTRENGTR